MSPEALLSRVLPLAFLVAAPIYYAESGWGGVFACVLAAGALFLFRR